MQKRKKKSTTSKKSKKGKYGEGHRMFGTDVKFKRTYPGEDPKHEEHPDPVEDVEDTLPEPNDEASKHKFPPPKKHPTFRRIWMDFIDSVANRENFKTGHLNSLEILCDLHVEYEDLQKWIRKHGRSYKSFGRAGLTHKPYPEVLQLTRVQSQIKDYMKMLGLLLRKDGSTQSGGEKSEWE